MFTQIENPFVPTQILKYNSFETERSFNWGKFIIFFSLIFFAFFGILSILIYKKKQEDNLIKEQNEDIDEKESET